MGKIAIFPVFSHRGHAEDGERVDLEVRFLEFWVIHLPTPMMWVQWTSWPSGLRSELVKESPATFQSGGYWGFCPGLMAVHPGAGALSLLRHHLALGFTLFQKPQACWTGFREWQVDGKRRRQREGSAVGGWHFPSQLCPHLFVGRPGTMFWRHGKEEGTHT